jgi:hypothetical protein
MRPGLNALSRLRDGPYITESLSTSRKEVIQCLIVINRNR